MPSDLNSHGSEQLMRQMARETLYPRVTPKESLRLEDIKILLVLWYKRQTQVAEAARRSNPRWGRIERYSSSDPEVLASSMTGTLSS